MDEQETNERFKKLKTIDKAKRLRLDDYAKKSMSTAEGREYVYWLLSICKTFQQPFTANALTTSFNCGELNIGQQILAHVVEVAPNDYLKMLREKQEEKEYVNRTNNADDANN